MNKNPFLSIVPRKTENIVALDKEVKQAKKMAKGIEKGKILFISGEYGSGKSLILKKLEKAIPKKVEKKEFIANIDLMNDLKGLPMEEAMHKKLVVYIDRMDLIEVMKKKQVDRIVEMIIVGSEASVGFIISITPRVLNNLFKRYPDLKNKSSVYEMKPLSLKQTKELVLSRLNESRKKKSKKFEPFTKEEIEYVWKKSKGNPRMILLICATLYDAKMQEVEK